MVRSFYKSNCRSVCLSVRGKIKNSKTQNSLIIFINFGASLRIGSMEGGWEEGGFRGEGRLIIIK